MQIVNLFTSVLMCVLPIIESTKLSSKSNLLLMKNRYVSVTFNINDGFLLSDLRGDFQGSSNYGANLIASGGMRLERENSDGSISTLAKSGKVPKIEIEETDECSTVIVRNLADDVEMPTVSVDWTFSLCHNDRFLRFSSTGYVLPTAYKFSARSSRHSMYGNTDIDPFLCRH